MKALVYHGPGRRSWDDVPDPVVQQPTDAVVRVDAVTICGTDLHILKGDVPEVVPGRILGHEAHRFHLDDFEDAYDVFARAGETGAAHREMSSTSEALERKMKLAYDGTRDVTVTDRRLLLESMARHPSGRRVRRVDESHGGSRHG